MFTQDEPVKQKELKGTRVLLRPFAQNDIKYLEKWSNDAELRKLTGEVEPMSRADCEKFCYDLRNSTDRIWFVIVLAANGKVIGEAGLLRMFRPWRTTDMTVIIGEKDERGKGYGTEAGHLLLDYTINRLGFHRVSIGVVGFNERALKFWRALGFKEEGIERDGYFCDGKYSNFVNMSILENEYRAHSKHYETA